MTRDTAEWIATNDNQAIPPRVKERVHRRAGGICAGCTRPIVGKLRPAYDHRIALCNGGQHREANLQLLCVPCHAIKTKADVAEKSIVARKRAKHLGIRPNRKTIQSRGFPKADPQRSASRALVRRGSLISSGSDHG